jgi:hypothetical protein
MSNGFSILKTKKAHRYFFAHRKIDFFETSRRCSNSDYTFAFFAELFHAQNRIRSPSYIEHVNDHPRTLDIRKIMSRLCSVSAFDQPGDVCITILRVVRRMPRFGDVVKRITRSWDGVRNCARRLDFGLGIREPSSR